MEINATLIVQLALFLMLLAFLSHFLFGPLQKLQDERKKRIEGPKAEAKEMFERGQTKAMHIEDELVKSSMAARAEFSRHREEGAVAYRKAIEEAKESTRLQIEGARKEVAQSLSAARMALAPEVGALATLAFDKVLGPSGKGHFGSMNGTGNSSNEEESHA
jgi:F-type H+-transporting ATPase subunit b